MIRVQYRTNATLFCGHWYNFFESDIVFERVSDAIFAIEGEIKRLCITGHRRLKEYGFVPGGITGKDDLSFIFKHKENDMAFNDWEFRFVYAGEHVISHPLWRVGLND